MFDPALFSFLRELAENNDRDWFNANKSRYQAHVLEPCLAFIEAFGPRLHSISEQFLAIPKAQGGSMFRIYRDTRFSKDKTPYKTHVAMQFRHTLASRDLHAPGFYLHLEPGGESGIGAGMWHPDSPSLGRIRDRVASDVDGWRQLRTELEGAGLAWMGESLKRPPRGYSADHPHVEDLKRKDWAMHTKLSDAEVFDDDVLGLVEREFRKGAPLVRFLCEAQDLPY